MASRSISTPIYLARASYRQRRLRDALRVVPVVGAVLWLLPVMSSSSKTGAVSIYIFVIWLLLILVSRVISGWLQDEDDTTTSAQDGRAQ